MMLFKKNPDQQLKDALNLVIDVTLDTSFGFDSVISSIKDAINNGADPAIHDDGNFKNTALTWAIIHNNKDLALFLVNHPSKHPNKIQLLNKAGQSLYVFHNTPLLLAIKNGWFDVALKLIENGADINKTIKDDGLSPLHLAILTLGCQENIQEQMNLIINMIEAGVDINKKDKFGKTPLDYLNTPLDMNELVICSYRKPLEDFLDMSDLSSQGERDKFIEEQKKHYDMYVEERNQIDQELSSNAADKAIEQLNSRVNSAFVNYYEDSEVCETAKNLIDDPSNSFHNLDDIKNSKKYLILISPKGGMNNITQLIRFHMEFHRKNDRFMESRSEYLSSPEHQAFCEKIRQITNQKENKFSL